MNNLMITGNTTILGKEIPIIEGGFSGGQKCILVNDISQYHNSPVRKINELINNNIKRFKTQDIMDLRHNENFEGLLRDSGIFTQNKINASKNIYLLSERGYIKLVSMMDNSNEKKWEVMDKIVDEYFKMREEIKTVKMYEKKSKLVEAESILLLDEVKGSSEYENFVNNAVRNELERIIYKTGIPVTYFCKEANISNSHMHMFRTRVRNLTQDRLEDLISVLYRAKYL